MHDLKTCPFCGKPAQTRVIPHDDMITLKVFCSGAGCVVEQYDRVQKYCSFDTLTRAMDNAMCAWNRRVNNLPVADVVKVVRCKDCVNWNGNYCITMHGLAAPKPNDFCARGEELEVSDHGQTT